MKPAKPLRRSVSPFGLADTVPNPLAVLQESFTGDFSAIPPLFEKVWKAPAHGAPELNALCESLLKLRIPLEDEGLWDTAMDFMARLFDRKTELFLVDHYDKAQCEKLGWAGEFRDVVLFSKERDGLIGQFFGPALENQPGDFSAFVNRWAESDNPDRIFHLLDFCAGSKDPTLDHFLLFTHPALTRILRDRPFLKGLFEKTKVAASKLTSPTWEKNARGVLSV